MNRGHALRSLEEALEWLRDHWNEQRPAPLRLHDGRTTDGELGGLRYSGAFQAALSWSPTQSRKMTSTVICAHPMSHGRTEDCPECQGSGVKDVETERYPYPMTTALARLAHVVPGRHLHPVVLVFLLAEHGWSYRLVRRLLPYPLDLTEGLTLRAIRQLHDRYEAGPVERTGWIDLSDAQRNAVLAGEVDAIA